MSVICTPGVTITLRLEYLLCRFCMQITGALIFLASFNDALGATSSIVGEC
jgi:hypothetical protein